MKILRAYKTEIDHLNGLDLLNIDNNLSKYLESNSAVSYINMVMNLVEI